MAYGNLFSIRDDFEDNLTAEAWIDSVSGSATAAETGGQWRGTLPSSVAGTHLAYRRSRATYDATASSFYVNIQTMVATGVAATAFFDLLLDAGNYLRWRQLSNTITVRTVTAGVETQQYTATWSATTYKYLRIRHSGTDMLFESSTNGTSWTLRATVAVSALFPITELYVQFGVTCGNIASPGSLRLDDVNIILPALSTNWRWTQALEALEERIEPITLALDTAGTAQAYVVTADGVDAAGDPSGSIRYFSGPASQGRVLTEQATQAAAQAMAVNIPADGRFDLPELVECKCIRLYHRSVDGSAYTLREFYPRRVIEADDIRAENIQGLHIAAGTITADRLSALLVVANTISTAYNGARVTLSGSPYGGFIGYGPTDTYDPVTGADTYQVIWSLVTGKFYAGTGLVMLDEDGVTFITDAADDPVANIKFKSNAGVHRGTVANYLTGGINQVHLIAEEISGEDSSAFTTAQALAGDVASAYILANKGIPSAYVRARIDAAELETIEIFAQDGTTVPHGLNVGGASGAAAGQLFVTYDDALTTSVPGVLTIGHNSSAAAAAGFGSTTLWQLKSSTTVNTAALQMNVTWATATHASRKARVQLFTYDTAAREVFRMEASGTAGMLSYFGGGAVAKQTVTGSRAANAALASLLTALSNYGLIVDSST